MITLGNIYDFVLANKSNKTFKEFNDAQIATLLIDGLRNKTLYYASNGNTVTGMILAEVHIPSKKLFVLENLAMTLANLREFARKAKEQFPGFVITGFKHEKYHTYNKFINRITK